MKNLFKRMTIIILAVVTILSFTSCSLESIPNGEIAVNTEQDSESFVQNEDFQYYLDPFSSFVKTENGYYFSSDLKLFFFDNETKQAYLICNKINCNHNNTDCMAYLSPLSFFPSVNLGYYKDSIYVVGFESESITLNHNYMYQISLSDFKRRKSTYLYDSSLLSMAYIMHRGYVYFTNDGGEMKESTASIFRAKLGNTDQDASEKVFEYSAIGANIVSLKAYGNYIFFKTASYEDIEGNGYKTALNCLNIHTLETRQLTGDIYSYLPDGGKVYYESDEKTVMSLDLETGEETLFCNIEGPCYISADSNYIYLDNRQAMSIYDDITERRINVYDKNGNYLTEIIPINPYDECFFGGDDVMIFKEVAELGVVFEQNGAEGYYVLDKSTLPASYEFTYMVSE